MACKYFKKTGLLKRVVGIMGYCQLQGEFILRTEKVGKIPHKYCEELKGKSNEQCGVYVESSLSKNKVV